MTDCGERNLHPAELHLFRERGWDLVLDVRRSRVRGLDALEASLLRCLDGGNAGPGPWNAGEVREAEERLLGEGLLLEQAPPPLAAFEPQPFVLTHLFVNVAQACNLRCPYCFAGQGGFGVEPQAMSADTACRTADFLLDHSGAEPRCGLTFIGGEPLLNWPVVEKAVLHAEAEAGRRGKEITFRLVTNGTLLTEAVVAFLGRHRVGVQVSLDGPASLQDLQRPTATGEGTHDAIAARLPSLLAEVGEDVRVRATVTRATPSLPDVVRHLETFGLRRISFGPVRTRNLEYALDEAGMARFLEGNAELAWEFVDRAVAGGQPHFGDFNRFLLFFCSGESVQPHCSALTTSLGVSASGGVYPCNALGEVDSALLGDVRGGLDLQKLEAWRGFLDFEAKPDCRACWARNVCGGGCLAMAHALEGDACRVDAQACEAIRRITELAIWMHVELRERAPDFFTRLVEESKGWTGR